MAIKGRGAMKQLSKIQTILLLLSSSLLFTPAVFAEIPANAGNQANLATAILQTGDRVISGMTSVINEARLAVIDFFTGAIENRNRADAEMIFMEPPGGNAAAMSNAEALRSAQSFGESQIRKKEIVDINWGLYLTPREGSDAIVEPRGDFVRRHTAFFCSPNSGIENEHFSDCIQDNAIPLQHGDLKISSLLSYPTYGPAERVLADEFIRNLISPFPSSTIRSLFQKDPGLEKQATSNRYAQLLATQAKLSVARNSLNEMYARRVPPSESGRSVMQVMDDEVNRRFANQRWYEGVSISSEAALLRELAHLEAFHTWMLYQQFLQNERIEALLATSISQQNEQFKIMSARVPGN